MDQEQHSLKKAVSLETFVFLILFLGVFTYIAVVMGFVNALSTFMQTAYRLLVDTVLFLAAIAVLAGAISGLLAEFASSAIDRCSPADEALLAMPGQQHRRHHLPI